MSGQCSATFFFYEGVIVVVVSGFKSILSVTPMYSALLPSGQSRALYLTLSSRHLFSMYFQSFFSVVVFSLSVRRFWRYLFLSVHCSPVNNKISWLCCDLSSYGTCG